MDDFEPDRLRTAAEDSLRRLAVDRVDLLLLHWPSDDVPLERSLEAMVSLREEGSIGQLGVSNFPAGLLRRALAAAPIFCNQVEYHPFLNQGALLAIAAEHDMLVTAYAPLAHGKALDHPVLQEIADAHGRSAGQVALRWLVEQPRVSPIPKASSHENRVANFEALDFELSADERRRIDALPKDRREFTPAWAPDWDA